MAELSAKERASKLVSLLPSNYRVEDDWVSLTDTIEQAIHNAEKQRGAEVLAAVHKEIAEVEKMITDNRNLGSYDELVDRLANLKPAASDLKALLREAELKGVKSLPECWHYNQDSREDFMDAYFKQRQERIAELEKARAEGKG